MKIKSKDIARELGLSTTAVSMALNGKKNISQQTKEKIFAYIEKNGGDVRNYYHPMEIERAMLCLVCYRKSGKVLSTDNSFFSCLLEGFKKEALKADYDLVVLWFDEGTADREGLTSQINALKPKGLIVIATEMQPDDTRVFEESGLPTIYLDNAFEELEVDTVSINNRKVVETALDVFRRNGYGQMGYFHSSVETDALVSRGRWLGMETEKRGIQIDPKDVIRLSPVMLEAKEELSRYLSKRDVRELPSAFFADTDQIAVGAMKALQEAGVLVGTEMSLIGFDNSPIGEMMDPPLTTMNVVKQDMAAMAINCLRSRIEKGITNHVTIYVAATYVERGTVCKNKV